MVELSHGAKRSLDEYLRQVKLYLQGAKTVDADEVEQNITEHIETELKGEAEPVSSGKLAAVLKRLGSPRQWVPEEELPWWRRIIFRLRTGPDDWRLAYISFGLLVLGLLLTSTAFVLIPAAFIVARAALSVTSDSEELGAQKWLFYPSLIVVYLFLAGTLLSGVSFLGFGLAEGLWWDSPRVREVVRMGTVVFHASVITIVTALWWTILGIIWCKWPTLVRSVFSPFADRLSRKWAVALLCTGLGLLILSAAATLILRFAVFSEFQEGALSLESRARPVQPLTCGQVAANGSRVLSAQAQIRRPLSHRGNSPRPCRDSSPTAWPLHEHAKPYPPGQSPLRSGPAFCVGPPTSGYRGWA